MADNSITLVGNLPRDPEIRFTATGRAVASFSMGVGRRYQVNGEWQEQTSWFNVTAWGQLGENAAATLVKGSRVVVTGRLEQREYTSREGEKRTAIDVVADDIGPSLRWATATVVRTPKQEGQGGGAANNRPANSGTNPGSEATPFDGEEPF
ncbi:MAG: single-stranded DNA-binding protein [Actinobacteria bacterium]|jgi:single-strand DNA-binding protein|nr:single-stranded DNA-binding protein [Actinomycetota bacterium]